MELLIAVTILAVIVVIVGRVVNATTNTVAKGDSRIDADSEARLVFDRLAIDIRRMPRRKELYYGLAKDEGNDRFSFFSEVMGTGAGTSGMANYSIVNYQILSDRLGRAAAARAWSAPFILVSSPQKDEIHLDNDFIDIGPQVFRFEYTFLLKPQTPGGDVTFSNFPYHGGAGENVDDQRVNGMQDVAAIVVGLGILDEKNRAKVTGSNISTYVNALPDSSGTSDILRTWRPALDTLNENQPSQSVRIYQRYFYLN